MRRNPYRFPLIPWNNGDINMNLIEKEAYTKLVTAFTDENVYGDLVDMLAKFSARFLYVEQFMTLGQIMEGSFPRATKLNSCITHAADNFYSVPRGRNRKVLIRNVSVTENITASKYDIISSYGDYDLVYALDYNRAASSTKVNIECYLTLGTGEQEIQGTGKLYLDIPDTNISEDIIVYDKDYPENKFTLTRDMIDLQEGSETTIAVLTQPNYSVRLWKATPFATDKTYVIKYLKCPDTNIEPLELTEIVNIPKLLFTPPASGGNSEIKETESVEYPLASLDDIYLYTITKVKFGNTIKTTDQISAANSPLLPSGISSISLKRFILSMNLSHSSIQFVDRPSISNLTLFPHLSTFTSPGIIVNILKLIK